MKKIRNNIFETNSSSTHTLVVSNIDEADYYPPGKRIAVFWADTDDDYSYCTLKEKVSYLVSHIARKYVYNVYKYEDLIDEIESDYEFKSLQEYLKGVKNGYEIVFPEKCNGDLEDLININHQLLFSGLEEALDDLIEPESLEDKIREVLSPTQRIELGRD